MAKTNGIETILSKYKKGSRKDYDCLVSKLSDATLSDGYLLKYIHALKDCATLLDNDFEVLVGTILKIDWMTRPEPIVQLYQSLILNIVSVHTVYLRACLKQLIKNFSPVISATKKDGGMVEVEIDDETMLVHSKGFQHVHTLLKTITKIVPMSTGMLVPLLVESYPYLTKDVYIQQCFLRNTLQITVYRPDIRVQILELVVERMIKFDVRAPRVAILATEEQNESQESGIFNMEDDNPVTDYSSKLDGLMTTLFEFVNNVCKSNGELDWEPTKTFYKEMLFVFEKVILPTYACCHVQFVMFYLVSLKMPLCDGFLDYLWKLVQNPNLAAVHRQSAVAYMGSLLARAKFVSIKTTMRTIELMMEWALNYTQMCQDTIMTEISRHGPFYCVCQSIFYVFVFRQKEFLDTKQGLKWAEGLQFQHLVNSRLNPLKVCFPLIVKSFASVTRQHQLAFCDHIIEQNNRSFLPVENSCVKNVLDTYFPFDPYVLKESAKYITPVYRDFDHSVEMADESSGEDDDDEDEMFTEDVSCEISMTPGALVAKGQLDFMHYGTSPGFKHL